MVAGASWRAAYWLPFGLDVVGLLLVFFFYHPINQFIHEEGKSKLDQVKELDWVGLALFASGLTLFLLGIAFGGTIFPWYVLLILGHYRSYLRGQGLLQGQ